MKSEKQAKIWTQPTVTRLGSIDNVAADAVTTRQVNQMGPNTLS